MFFLWINFDLLYCYDISLENFTESIFFTFLGGNWNSSKKVEYISAKLWHPEHLSTPFGSKKNTLKA